MNLRFSVNYDFQRNQMFTYTNISVRINPVEINGLSINPDWCRISLKFTMLMVKLFDKNISSLLLVYYTQTFQRKSLLTRCKL